MELGQKLLAYLFPSRCILCLQASHHRIEICTDCSKRLPHNVLCCVRCALPLADDINTEVLCGRCIHQLPEFDYVHSLFRYDDDIIKLVHQLKFSGKISFARSIGEMLLAQLRNTEEQPDCLLPVPLHASRMRQRGYNQSIEISRVLAKAMALPIEITAIKRHRSTLAQTGLNAKQRKKNIRGAFSVVGQLNYQHILIIDDVMTTGATVNELAALLKKNGAVRVGILCIARAPVKG